MLLNNGSLGCCPPQAWHRDSKGPCPLPPAWSYEESTGWHGENKVIITETPNVTICHGHEWLAFVVLWFHWNVFILAAASSTFEQRHSARNGWDRASDWSYQESTSCHMRKKFFCSFNFFCEKFPIKHCSTRNMWIRWSFRCISSSYFHRNIMYIWIFAHPRLTTYQLDWTRMLDLRK